MTQPTFRSYYWKLASKACLYCGDNHSLNLVSSFGSHFCFRLRNVELGRFHAMLDIRSFLERAAADYVYVLLVVLLFFVEA